MPCIIWKRPSLRERSLLVRLHLFYNYNCTSFTAFHYPIAIDAAEVKRREQDEKAKAEKIEREEKEQVARLQKAGYIISSSNYVPFYLYLYILTVCPSLDISINIETSAGTATSSTSSSSSSSGDGDGAQSSSSSSVADPKKGRTDIIHSTIIHVYYSSTLLYYAPIYYLPGTGRPKGSLGQRSINLGRVTQVLYYTILYYAILYYTILYYTILYYTILYYTILG